MRHHLLCATLGALLLHPLAAQETERESFQVTGERALRAVETFLGVELGRELVFRESTEAEVTEILKAELLPQFRTQLENEEAAKEACSSFAASMAGGLLAKYEVGTGNVLVLPETISSVAVLMEEPALDTPEVLQAILVHECVHVLADKQYGFAKKLLKLTGTDAILSYNAVIEGHAQFVARQVCKQKGWSEAFELFTSSIGKVPDLGDEALNLLARAQAVSASWAYYEGEAFMAAMFEADGEKGIERAYLDPPTSPSLIFHPDWYLDPSKQPKNDFDLEGALEEFGWQFDDEEWLTVQQTITPAQLRQALAMLGEKTVDRLLSHLETSRVSSTQTRNPPGEKLISAVFFVCDSASEASFLLASEERLLRLKDEQMKNGQLKIVDSSYTPQSRGSIQGLHAFKLIEFRGQKIPVSTVVLVKGRLVLELAFSNKKISEKDAMDAGVELLTRALDADAEKKEKPTDPAKKGPADKGK